MIAGELGGLSPSKRHAADLAADALHRALGAAARADARLPEDPQRTLVAMSGGVDSAVAALLAGPRAVAVTLELWSDPANDGERSCCSPQAVRGARELAHGMGLPHLSLDLRAEFRAGVVEPWLADHAVGLTPNPCVRCNGEVRLDEMLDLATRLGAGRLATGHYARIDDGLLRVGVDPTKDQSYMLAGLVGRLDRSAWTSRSAACARRRSATSPSRPGCRWRASPTRRTCASSPVPAVRPSSPGTAQAGERPGPIVDRSGRRLGRHRGQREYTVGQRRGLGVGGGEPLYVLEKIADTVVVGRRSELQTGRVTLRDTVLHRPAFDSVRLRYRQRPLACRVLDGPSEAGVLELELLEPCSAAAPGQVGCLMAGELVVGHGTIA